MPLFSHKVSCKKILHAANRNKSAYISKRMPKVWYNRKLVFEIYCSNSVNQMPIPRNSKVLNGSASCSLFSIIWKLDLQFALYISILNSHVIQRGIEKDKPTRYATGRTRLSLIFTQTYKHNAHMYLLLYPYRKEMLWL